MEKDQLQSALLDREGEGGSVGLQMQEPARDSPPAADRTLDARNRRGSLGPPPGAAPLSETAPAAALHAHLAHLLEPGREPEVPAPAVLAEQRPTPHEDLARLPDGVPHLVIGLTALFSVLFAAVLISVFMSGHGLGRIAVIAAAVIGVPWLVFRLGAKAERERDHNHPSR